MTSSTEWQDREFEIGDVVEIGSEKQLAEVTGVIHDSRLLFVWFPDGEKEEKFNFGAVVKQWREVPPPIPTVER